MKLMNDLAYLIAFGLYNNVSLKKLDLSSNNISVFGMDKLSAAIEHTKSLNYVDLSKNKSSQWGVYCNMIKYCGADSLTLCGDERMIAYNKKITNSLQMNTTLKSLTFQKIGAIGIQSIKYVLNNQTTLRELNVSYGSKGTKTIKRKMTYSNFNNTRSSLNSHEGSVDINVSYDGDQECSSEAINMSNVGISYDEICIITFGLHNNVTVKFLDLSCNNITDDGIVTIMECLKHNNTLKQLNLSQNLISLGGMSILSDCIEHYNRALRALEYVDL